MPTGKTKPFHPSPGTPLRTLLMRSLACGLVALPALLVAETAPRQGGENGPLRRPVEPPPPPPQVAQYIQDGAPPSLPKDLPTESEMRAQLMQLERFLELSPDKIRQMRTTLQRIEAMSPEEREALRQRLSHIRTANLPQHEEFQRNEAVMDSFSPEDRELIRDYWLHLDEAERVQRQRILAAMHEEQRRRYWVRVVTTMRSTRAGSSEAANPATQAKPE